MRRDRSSGSGSGSGGSGSKSNCRRRQQGSTSCPNNNRRRRCCSRRRSRSRSIRSTFISCCCVGGSSLVVIVVFVLFAATHRHHRRCMAFRGLGRSMTVRRIPAQQRLWQRLPYSSSSSSHRLNMVTDSRELRFFSSPVDVAASASAEDEHGVLGGKMPLSLSWPQWPLLLSKTSMTTTTTTSTTTTTTTGGGGRAAAMMMGLSASTVVESVLSTLSSTVVGTVEETDIVSSSGRVDRKNGRRQEQKHHNGRSGRSRNYRYAPPAKRYTGVDQPPRQGYGPSIPLTDEERELFALLRHVRQETGLSTTLRVAGGWVRDKLLATPEFRAHHRVFDVGKNDVGGSGGAASGGGGGIGGGRRRLTSKFHKSAAASMGRLGTKILVSSGAPKHDNGSGGGTTTDSLYQQPVDIDIALDDMLGREFADHLNEYLSGHGQDTVPVGVVLKNPEKSKHLETATMKVGSFWIDLVNLRAEEYAVDSRIPDLMRIGTAAEDAHRRDLTINALFFNVNTGQVEDWTGRGFDDLRKGVVATPLQSERTLLDDPLRLLRSVRFAARLRFRMDAELIAAAKGPAVRAALARKVSRERVGGELDLMLRSPDPVNAVRLLVNLRLVGTVFPMQKYVISDAAEQQDQQQQTDDDEEEAEDPTTQWLNWQGLHLMSTAHDHLADCRYSPPVWFTNDRGTCCGFTEPNLTEDEEARRLLWYAAFLKPFRDRTLLPRRRRAATTLQEEDESGNSSSRRRRRRKGGSSSRSKSNNRSDVTKLLVDDLKRPSRDAEAVERIARAADDFRQLVAAGCDVSATMILLSGVRVAFHNPGEGEEGRWSCSMNGRDVDSVTEEDPVWQHAMEFRLLCSKVVARAGPLWRAGLVLAIAEELASLETAGQGLHDGDGDDHDDDHAAPDNSPEEMRRAVMERYDSFAAAMQQMGLIGIWKEKPLLTGDDIRQVNVLPNIPKGPAFRQVMEEQSNWMILHPAGSTRALEAHLRCAFPDYT